MSYGQRSRDKTHGKLLLLASLLAVVALLASACFDSSDDAAAPVAGQDGELVSPGTPSEGDEGPGESEPSGGGGSGVTGEEEPPEGPEPGEPTLIGFEVLARGTDPVEGRFTPEVLLARTAEEGDAAANASPAPGAATVLREWDDYDARSIVVVLGGSQPDAAHRLALRSVNIIKNGGRLLASGRIIRPKGAAAQVISIPWVALAVDAEAADTVERCTLSLESATTPFDTSCG